MGSLSKYKLLFYLILLGSLILVSCNRMTYERMYPTLNDGKYDTEFPYRDCSNQLDDISLTVKKIFCLADYKTFTFEPEQKLTSGNIQAIPSDSLRKISKSIINTSEAATGTGTIIYYENNRIALLTCAHILNFPDTVYTYYEDNDPATIEHLQGISIKSGQRNFFREHSHGHDLEILAFDREKDLAILGKIIDSHDEYLQVFPHPLGNSKKLEWGSFVYVLGYPLGYQMITRGIVSRSAPSRQNYFLIDAAFNEGFSGGIVLAIKDGVPNFELVGLGKSASGTFENILVPEKQDHEFIYNPGIPYSGDVYVDLRKKVNYGITYAISTEAMKDFYKTYKTYLEMQGYYLSRFFGAK